MTRVGIKILVRDITRTSKAGKRKKRQTKTRKRSKKRRQKAIVPKTRGFAQGEGGPRRPAPGAR